MSVQNLDERYGLRKTAVALFVAGAIARLVGSVTDALVEPLFSADLDGDGVPDLRHVRAMTLKVGPWVLPVGRVALERH